MFCYLLLKKNKNKKKVSKIGCRHSDPWVVKADGCGPCSWVRSTVRQFTLTCQSVNACTKSCTDFKDPG